MKLNITLEVDCDPNDEDFDDSELLEVEKAVIEDLKDNGLETYLLHEVEANGVSCDYQFTDVAVSRVESEDE